MPLLKHYRRQPATDKERGRKDDPSPASGKKPAGAGRRVKFHGAFKDKARAQAKEQEVKGWIEERMVKGHPRFVVMTRL